MVIISLYSYNLISLYSLSKLVKIIAINALDSFVLKTRLFMSANTTVQKTKTKNCLR